MQNKTPEGMRVNWGMEVLRVLGTIGKVVLKLLSYVFNILMTVLLIGLITGIIVCSVFAIYINNYLDLEIDPDLIASVSTNSTTQIYYVDYETPEDRQNRIGTLVEVEDQRLYGTENSIYASYNQFPENLVNAFIAVEDKRFRTHNGVDWWTTAQAVYHFITGTGSAGGSTITQQLIKNITDEDEVKVQRKVEEIFRALNLEKEKSKEEIIEAYLNIVFLGNGCEGVQSAANKYFDKDVSELTLVECACLASIVKNPSQYEPVYHDQGRYKENGDYVEGNADRRWVVLKLMHQEGYITEDEMLAAQEEQLDLKFFREDDTSTSDDGMLIYSWYTESLIDQLKEDLMEKYDISERSASLMILTGGLTIVTPMDPDVQSTLEEVYENDMEYFPSVSSGIQPQSAMVVMDPYTGDVLGLVGGRGEKTINLGTNRASVSRRPPGSSIKPLSVYAPALEAGIITYGSVVDDTPYRFNPYEISPQTEWSDAVYGYTLYPRNYPDVFMGLTTINSAVERSVNTIAMKVLDQLGIERSFDFMKETLHFDSLIESETKSNGEIITDKGLAALSLGQPNYGVTVLEMTAAYCMFQNHGVYNTPNLYLYVLDGNGEVILDNRTKSPDIVMSEENASIMTTMLQNVVNNGTATGVTLRYSVDVAAKTGTTTADFDRYFVGYTPYYVGGVWTGYDYNQSLSAFGQSPSLIIWDKVMTMLHQKYIDEANSGGEPLKTFEQAPGVIEVEYCKDSGLLPTDACRMDPRGHRIEKGYFTRETAPKDECDTHVIVKRDTVTNLIACPQCNPKDCTEVALIRVEDRSFPTEVYIMDAQYTYREMDSSVKPAGWWGVPFYSNMLEEGEYCGNSGVTTPYNAYCYFHCDYRPWGGDAPAEDSGWNPETTEPEKKPEDKETDEPNAGDPPDDEETETDDSVNPDIFTGDDWFTD